MILAPLQLTNTINMATQSSAPMDFEIKRGSVMEKTKIYESVNLGLQYLISEQDTCRVRV